MNKEKGKEKELSQLTGKLLGMTFILKAYCDNLDDKMSEASNLQDFSNILYVTSSELFDLL